MNMKLLGTLFRAIFVVVLCSGNSLSTSADESLGINLDPARTLLVPCGSINSISSSDTAAIEKGEQLFKEKHYAQAIELLTSIVNSLSTSYQVFKYPPPELTIANFYLGLAHQNAHNLPEAEKRFNATAKLLYKYHPENNRDLASIAYYLADYFERHNKLADAQFCRLIVLSTPLSSSAPTAISFKDNQVKQILRLQQSISASPIQRIRAILIDKLAYYGQESSSRMPIAINSSEWLQHVIRLGQSPRMPLEESVRLYKEVVAITESIPALDNRQEYGIAALSSLCSIFVEKDFATSEVYRKKLEQVCNRPNAPFSFYDLYDKCMKVGQYLGAQSLMTAQLWSSIQTGNIAQAETDLFRLDLAYEHYLAQLENKHQSSSIAAAKIQRLQFIESLYPLLEARANGCDPRQILGFLAHASQRKQETPAAMSSLQAESAKILSIVEQQVLNQLITANSNQSDFSRLHQDYLTFLSERLAIEKSINCTNQIKEIDQSCNRALAILATLNYEPEKPVKKPPSELPEYPEIVLNDKEFKIRSSQGMKIELCKNELKIDIEGKFVPSEVDKLVFRGDFKDALPLCKQAVAKQPTIENYNNLACCLIELNDFQGAVQACDAGLHINNQDPFLLSTRGQALNELGRHDDAVADFSKAVSLSNEDDDDYSALMMNGTCQSGLGNNLKSVQLLTRAIQKCPRLWLAYAYRSKAYHALNQSILESLDLMKSQQLKQIDPVSVFESNYRLDGRPENQKAHDFGNLELIWNAAMQRHPDLFILDCAIFAQQSQQKRGCTNISDYISPRRKKSRPDEEYTLLYNSHATLRNVLSDLYYGYIKERSSDYASQSAESYATENSAVSYREKLVALAGAKGINELDRQLDQQAQ